MCKMPLITIGCPIHNRQDCVIPYLRGLQLLQYPTKEIQLLFLINNSTDNTDSLLQKFKKANLDSYFDIDILYSNLKYNDDREDRNPKMFVKLWNTWIDFAKGDFFVHIDSDVYIRQWNLKKDVQRDLPVIGGQVWNGGTPPYYFYNIARFGGKIQSEDNEKEYYNYIHHRKAIDSFREVFGIMGGCRLIKADIFDECEFQYHPQGEDLGLMQSIRDNTNYRCFANPSIITFHNMNIKKYVEQATIKKKGVIKNKFVLNKPSKEGA